MYYHLLTGAIPRKNFHRFHRSPEIFDPIPGNAKCDKMVSWQETGDLLGATRDEWELVFDKKFQSLTIENAVRIIVPDGEGNINPLDPDAPAGPVFKGTGVRIPSNPKSLR